MSKIISLVIIVICIFQTTSFAQVEFIRGKAPEHEIIEVRDEEGDMMKYQYIMFNVDGVQYVYNKGENSNPVPYDESLSEILDKEYIVTDDYYIAYDSRNTGAIAAGAYMPHTTLMIYDKQMNLIHEEDFGGGVCIRAVGYFGGMIYCQYSEKTVTITDEKGTYTKRSYNPVINRNDLSERIRKVTVKSSDMINWDVCEEEIPISNSRTSILANKISLYEQDPMTVLYENNTEYEKLRNDSKLGDWFVVCEISEEKRCVENIYLSNDYIYFIPLDIPQEAKTAFDENNAQNFEIYEYNGNIIVNFKYLKYYLQIPAIELYSKLNQMKNLPYIQFQDTFLGFETPPIIEDGSTLVPMRFLFEQMGADVEWNQETQTATATLNNTAVTFSIDDTEASVNNTSTTMNVPARLINDKTMVPLRFLSEEMGYTVTWDDATHTAIIE